MVIKISLLQAPSDYGPAHQEDAQPSSNSSAALRDTQAVWTLTTWKGAAHEGWKTSEKKKLKPFLLTVVNNVDTYHRIIVTLRLEGIWGSSSSTPLPMQDHLEQFTQKPVQVGFECSQTGRLHNLPGQPVPMLWHPQRTEILSHDEVKRKHFFL